MTHQTCPQCGSENADYITELSDNDENTLLIIVCQCPDCGEETIVYPEFPDYSGF